MSPKSLFLAVSLVLFILIFNTVLLARAAGLVNFPGKGKLDIAREGAALVIVTMKSQPHGGCLG